MGSKPYIHRCPNCHDETASESGERTTCRECGTVCQVVVNNGGRNPNPHDPRNARPPSQRQSRPL